MEFETKLTIFCIIAGIILLGSFLSFKKLNKETLELYNFKVISEKILGFTCLPLCIFVLSSFQDGVQKPLANMMTGFMLVCVVYFIYIMKKTSFKIALKSTVLLIPILIASIPLGVIIIGILILELSNMVHGKSSGGYERTPQTKVGFFKDYSGTERYGLYDPNDPNIRH